MMPPGSRLLAFASRWFDDPTVARVFQPLVADWQHEWSAASQPKRRWIAVRGRIAFAVAFLAAYPRLLRTPTPSWLVRRVLIRIAVFGAIVTVLGVILLLRDLTPQLQGASLAIIAAVVLIPLAPMLMMLLSLAAVVGIDAIRGHEGLSPDAERTAAVRLMIGITLWMIVGGGWVVPAVSQTWRTAVSAEVGGAPAGYAPPRGVQELSTYELVFHPDRAFVQRTRPEAAARREIIKRASLVLAPLLFVWIRWCSLEPGRKAVPPQGWMGTYFILSLLLGQFILIPRPSGAAIPALLLTTSMALQQVLAGRRKIRTWITR